MHHAGEKKAPARPPALERSRSCARTVSAALLFSGHGAYDRAKRRGTCTLSQLNVCVPRSGRGREGGREGTPSARPFGSTLVPHAVLRDQRVAQRARCAAQCACARHCARTVLAKKHVALCCATRAHRTPLTRRALLRYAPRGGLERARACAAFASCCCEREVRVSPSRPLLYCALYCAQCSAHHVRSRQCMGTRSTDMRAIQRPARITARTARVPLQAQDDMKALRVAKLVRTHSAACAHPQPRLPTNRTAAERARRSRERASRSQQRDARAAHAHARSSSPQCADWLL
jgi:hypothetical protein